MPAELTYGDLPKLEAELEAAMARLAEHPGRLAAC